MIARSVDAAPLAHALGTAIERQRLLSGARAACMEDPFTGLLNRTAFLALADRDRKLAEKLGCRWMIVMAEPSDFGASLPAVSRDKENITAEGRDLLLIETAERLRRFAGPTDLLARVGDCRFGLGIFDTAAETLELAWSRIHSTARESRIAIGAAIFDFSHPAPLEALIEQAEMDLTPKAMAVRTQQSSCESPSTPPTAWEEISPESACIHARSCSAWRALTRINTFFSAIDSIDYGNRLATLCLRTPRDAFFVPPRPERICSMPSTSALISSAPRRGLPAAPSAPFMISLP